MAMLLLKINCWGKNKILRKVFFSKPLTVDDVFSEEDPAGAEERPEAEEEADEEPYAGAANAEAAVRERVAAELPVGDGVHPAFATLQSTGTDAMIFKRFLPKNSAKKRAVFTQNKAKLIKNFDHNIGF
jgi:hypothetical protein